MENTKKIIIRLDVGYAGMTSHEGWIIPQSMTEDEIYELAYERALENAAMYGYYPPDYEDQDEEDEDTCGDKISHNIEGSWVDYDEKKHAGKISYGTGGPQFNEF